MTSRVDLTIIGGGPVGLFASFYAGLRGMTVRIIDSLPDLGGQLTALYPEKYVYDMPGFPKVLAKDLAAQMSEQGLQYQPEVCLGITAQELTKDEDGYTLVGSNGTSYPTRTIIIAAGNGSFTPTKIGVEREDEFFAQGHIHYGVRELSKFSGKKLAIIGGGDSAFDWALGLHDIAGEIHLVHRRDQFRAHEDTVNKVREKSKVQFKLWNVVKELHGNGHLTGLTLENTQTRELAHLPVETVIVNIGFKSSLGPLKDWGLVIEKNQIVVDHLYQTSLPGVFSVGDVCSYPGKIKLIATGVGEAATAVCLAKTMLDPAAKLFPGHSSDRDE